MLALNSGGLCPSLKKDLTCFSVMPISPGFASNTWCSLLLSPEPVPSRIPLNQFSPLTGLLSAPFQNPALPFLLGLRFESPVWCVRISICVSFSSFGLSIQEVACGLCGPLTWAAPFSKMHLMNVLVDWPLKLEADVVDAYLIEGY